MNLTFEEISRKEVINLCDGSCYGFADDIVIDTETRKVSAVVIRGRKRFFGLLGREEDVFVHWQDIETIGKDTILVKSARKIRQENAKQNIFQKILNIFL